MEIKHDYHSLSVLVVGACDCSESLLSGSVPDLKFGELALHLYSFEPKINSDCGQIALLKLVICKPPKERGLSDRGISDNNNLEQVIVFRNHFNVKT